MRINEIVSDYRVVPPGTGSATCVPGQWGAQSIIPQNVKHSSQWVKAEPSPVWIRAGGGDSAQLLGMPYPDPHAFSAWLASMIGPPHPDQQLILIGLMLEVCVLSTVQELYYRGYRAAVLFEGVDTYTGSVAHKQMLFDTLFPFWGRGITWQQLIAQQKITP